jgi:hypothetical protein
MMTTILIHRKDEGAYLVYTPYHAVKAEQWIAAESERKLVILA